MNEQAKLHILHVDDEPDLAELTAEYLTRHDARFDIDTATSASEGIDHLAQNEYDCIVSDYDMPGENGIEFLQAVREDYPDLPFLLYTGKGSEEVASDAISSGVTDYLQKESGTGQYELLANRIRNAVEQHQAERRAELSHQAMDTANEGLSLVRPDGTFSYVNPAFAQLFGYNPEELIGEHWTVLYHNEEAERLDNDILPAVTEHGYWSGETVRLTKQGERLVTDHRLSHTAEDVIVCTAQDITPERTASSGQSTELDFLVENMDGHAFYTLDHEGYITSWNEGAERLTGYSASDVLGKHIGQLFTEEDRERGLPETLIETAKIDGTVTDQGWRVCNDDSQIRTFDTISASYDTSGTIRGFGVMMREATADPITEELHRTTNYLDAILESTVQPLFMKETTGEYLLANREYKRLFDLQDETVVGRTDYDLHPEEMAEEVRANDREVFDTEEPVEREERVIVEGEERIYLSSKVPVYFDDDGDEPDAVFGMATDITERKERERELEQIRERMEFTLEGTNSVIYDVDLEEHQQTRHGAFERLYGLTPEEHSHTSAFYDAAIHPEDREKMQVFERMDELRDRDTVEWEYRTHPDRGEVRWLYSIADIRSGPDGEPTRAFGLVTDITERKEREQELERKGRAMDEAPIGITMTDPHQADNPLIYANDTFLALTGHSREEVIGWNHRVLQGPNTDADPVAELRRAIDAGESTTVELRNYRKDGTMFWNRVWIAPLRDDTGAITNWVGFQADVTHRKQQERQLKEERRRFRTLFDQLSQPLVEVEYDGLDPIVEDVNPKFEATFGYSADELIGESLDAYIIPDDREDEAAEINSHVRDGGQLISREVRRQTAGGLRDFLLENAVYDDGSGGFAIYTDITERKEREQALQHYETLIETLPIGYVRTSFDDDFLDMNSTFVELLDGESEEEIKSHAVSEFYRDPTTRERLLDTLREEGTVDSEELKMTTMSGETVWVTVTGRSVDGEDEAYVDALVQDITEQKRHERQLRRKNERLEEFASVASHDLRNPLNVASGRLELAAEECDSTHLDDVANALNRMETLVDDLLTLAREGEPVSDPEPVALDELCRMCWETVLTEEASLDVETQLTVEGDRTRLKQLFENLMRNAIDHGGSDTTVTVGTLDDGFYVADTGSGIPEDMRSRVFNSGYSSSEDGTGFGLAIVKEIAEAHGWEIRVSDSDGGGARFEFTGVEITDG